MKKWNDLTRKQRIPLYFLMLLGIAGLCYIAAGCPTLTPEMAMGRAERAALVGPSVIVGYESIDYGNEQMILGETEYGYVLYGYSRSEYTPFYYNEQLVYRAKDGDLTVTAMTTNNSVGCNGSVPIILFDRYPAAVRAEIEISASIDDYGEIFDFSYELSADRENSGYFRFDLPTNQDQFSYDEAGRLYTHYNNMEAVIENEMIHQISQTLAGGWNRCDDPVCITVRLYNKAGELITEDSISASPYDDRTS